MPLPCSPVSNSTASENSSHSFDDDDESEDSLITPRPGPAAQAERTIENLSTPLPAFHKWSSQRHIPRLVSSSDSLKTGSEREGGSKPQEEGAQVKVKGQEGETSKKQDTPATPATESEQRETNKKQDPAETATTEGHPPQPYPIPTPSLSPKLPSPKSARDQKPSESDTITTKPSPKLTHVPERQKSVTFHPSTSTPHISRQGSYSSYLMARRASPAFSPAQSPGASGRGRFSEEAESSADENTAIVRRRAAGYGATEGRREGGVGGLEGVGTGAEEEEVEGGDESPTKIRRKSGSGKSGKGGRVGSQTDQGRTDGTQEEESEKEGWWRGFVEKYGSVELENKGSVARDHLALGECRRARFTFTFTFTHRQLVFQASRANDIPRRTHLPSLAPHLPLLRLHRNRSNPTVPPQHHHLPGLFLHFHHHLPLNHRLHPSPPDRQTPRRHLPRREYPGPAPRLP